MSISVVQIINVNAAVKRLNVSPFLKGMPVELKSIAGTTVYAVNHPGTDTVAKYARFKQTISGNKAFKLPTAMTAPTQTNGAVAAADQLRTIVLSAGTPLPHTNDAAVAAASSFCIGMGGGTAVADATLSVKGTTAADLVAGSTTLSIASSGANTKTLLVGDIIGLASHTTVYRVTGTTYTLNGATEVEVAITPPLQQAVVAGDVITVTTSDDRTILFATAPAVGTIVEVIGAEASGDIVTLTSGALTANRPYEVAVYDFVHTAGIADFTRLVG